MVILISASQHLGIHRLIYMEKTSFMRLEQIVINYNP